MSELNVASVCYNSQRTHWSSGGSVVVSVPCVRKVTGSNPILAAMQGRPVRVLGDA